MKKTLLAITVALAGVLTCRGINPGQMRWHNEETDTTAITNILVAVADSHPEASTREYVSLVATMLLDRPYVAGTLEQESGEEMLTVNMDEFDCTTFVETVGALALTLSDHRTSWRDFVRNLESLRYRGGSMGGYSSRLHYISDWVVDNTSRGNIVEMTTRMPVVDYQVKTLDFMTSHRDKYLALADDNEYSKIKNVEAGFRSHRYPYVKKGRLYSDKKVVSALCDGDILALTTDIAGLDVSHMGIVKVIDGVPYLLHASSKGGKVMVDPLSLADYLKRAKGINGFRLLRFTR